MRAKYRLTGRMISLSLMLMVTVFLCAVRSPVEASAGCTVSAVKHLLRVPMTRQNTDYTCGVTALQSVLGYYGFEKRLDELSIAVKPDPDKGTDYLNMANYAKEQGFAVSIHTDMTLRELKNHIDHSEPVLLAIQAWADTPNSYLAQTNEDGHYVVAIGYDNKNIYLMDPSTLGHYTYIPTEEFLLRWHDYDSYSGQVLNRFGMVLIKAGAERYNPEQITRLD